MRERLIGFLVWSLAVVAVFWLPLSRLVRESLAAGYSSHIVLVPFITAYLIWSERSKIFSTPFSSVPKAALTATVAVIFAIIGFSSALSPSIVSLLTVVSVLLLVIAGFILFFGTSALKRALFPIMLLGLMLPIPGFLIDKVIYFLQSESADLSTAMFSLLGIPVLRDGFILSIPGVTVEVAKECSGINSSMALVITMLLVAHETLRTTWRKIVLVLLVIPLSILKNAIRIVTLTVLATRVDPSFLTGRLHHEGGFVFFLITLALVYPIWKLLRKTEIRSEDKAKGEVVSYSAAAP